MPCCKAIKHDLKLKIFNGIILLKTRNSVMFLLLLLSLLLLLLLLLLFMNLKSSFQGVIWHKIPKKCERKRKSQDIGEKKVKKLKTKGNNIFLLSLVNYVVHTLIILILSSLNLFSGFSKSSIPSCYVTRETLNSTP